MRSSVRDRPRWLAGPVMVLVAASLIPGAVPGLAQTGAAEPPTDLSGRVDALGGNLTRIAAADTLEQARAAHRQVLDLAPGVLPHAADLAGRHGELVATLLDELDTQLAAGNLSDARSLAQAAVNTLEDEIVPRVDRWAVNRTAVAPGPIRHGDDGLRVAIVLVNPPPARIGAIDVTLSTGEATPLEATVATGQGEATVDAGNRTARVASFDAQALANLDATSRERIVLGEVTLDATGLSAGDTLELTVDVQAIADRDGREVLALGLAHQGTVPATEDTGLVPATRWLALGGLVGGAAIVVTWIRRWEL